MISAIILVFLSFWSVKCARSAALPEETDCQSMTTLDDHDLYDHFKSANDVSSHYEGHPGLRQFDTYKRSTAQDVSAKCDVINIGTDDVRPVKSSALCPVKYVCNYDANRYPYLFFEAVCVDRLGQFKAFQCTNNTFPIHVLKREACNSNGLTAGWKWSWTTETIKTGCHATNAQHGVSNLMERLNHLIHPASNEW